MGAIHANDFTEHLYRQVNQGWLRGMYLRDSKVQYSDDKTERTYKLYDKKHKPLVEFRARPLPGCCGMLVVYYLRPMQGSKDSAKLFNDTLALIIDTAGRAKFGSVLLTQTMGSAGWNALNDGIGKFLFTNWKTSNQVGVFQFETKEPEGLKKKEPVFDGE